MGLMPTVPVMRVLDPGVASARLRTGDVLLFSGRGLASDTVRLFTRSYWSHIGIVVRIRGINQPLVLESTTLSETNDLFQGRPVSGVALVPFADRVNEYDGVIALRQWHGDALSPARQRMIERLALRLCHRPYKNYVFCHLRAWLTGYPERDFSSMFCSELVAELYRRAGRLPSQIDPRRFVPGHFASDGPEFIGGGLGDLQHLRDRTDCRERAAVRASFAAT